MHVIVWADLTFLIFQAHPRPNSSPFPWEEGSWLELAGGGWSWLEVWSWLKVCHSAPQGQSVVGERQTYAKPFRKYVYLWFQGCG